MESLKKLLQSLARMFAGEKPKSTLDPSELTKAVLDEANANAKDWDDQVDLPNAFEVRIPRGEWDSYYGSRVRQTEGRLARSLRQFAGEIGATMEEPVVTLTVDGSVPAGEVVVSASFTAPSELSATPVLSAVPEDSDDHVTVGWASTPVPAPASAAATTPVFVRPQVAQTTPRPVRPSASVSVPEGPSFEVGQGSTVGIVRDPSRECPAIGLPYSESLETCSQIQGEFRHGGAGWDFVDRGRNGTRVRRGAEITQLDKTTFALRDNDMLYFGVSELPALVFHEKVS